MAKESFSEDIKNWLADRGHNAEEVEKIMKRLEQFDETTVRDSIFDSIETGGFDMEAIIKEALADDF
jgi:hypothetical protein